MVRPEVALPIQEVRYRGPVPPMVHGNVYERTARSLRDEACQVLASLPELEQVRAVSIEGPPIYLGQRSHELPLECRWSSPAFCHGWELASEVTTQIGLSHPSITVDHHVLVDDINFLPGDGLSRSDFHALTQVRQQHGVLQHHSIRRWEREFRINPDDTCAVMDARFQLGKVVRSPDGLHIVVHPNGFARQQQAMMEQVLGLMKQDPGLSRLSKQQRRDIVSRYRHVWIDVQGDLSAVTRPEFDGNRFQHIPIV